MTHASGPVFLPCGSLGIRWFSEWTAIFSGGSVSGKPFFSQFCDFIVIVYVDINIIDGQFVRNTI